MKTTCWKGGHIYIVKFSIVLFSVFITHCSFAQVNDNAKLSPALSNEIKNAKAAERLLLEITIKNDKVPAEVWKPAYQAKKVFESSTFSVFRLLATAEEINTVLLPLPEMIFIETGNRIPKEELLISNLDMSVNKIN